MREWRSVFKGKKITVMGLGLLGRGVGDVAFLAEQGAELIVTDVKSEEELAPSLKRLETYAGITYRLGGHDAADFKNRDYILKAAGIPPDSPYIAEARKNAIPIKMSSSWFAELANIPIIGVTGTRGKSTVTHLIHHILETAGVHALLGGNVRGVSTLSLLPQVQEGSVGVFELDSWQCQGFGEENMSPGIAVFTTLYPDHLNYYQSMERYLEDKAQIFLHQKPGDTLILGLPIVDTILNTYGPRITSHVVVANPAHFPEHWTIALRGAHNLLNAVCAIEAARAYNIPDEKIREGVATFKGVPGRMELLGEWNGVKIYNDTTATTPEATIAGLRAIPAGDIVLIMGGADKGLDMSELASILPAYTKHIVLLSGSGTDTFLARHPEAFEEQPTVHESLRDALHAALHAAKPGDSILLSPAFASFGMFRNEFDRGDQFVELVKELGYGDKAE